MDTSAETVAFAVLGAFGGVGLVLVHVVSRRGPLIYVVYAALLVLITLLLGQYSPTAFNLRFAAVLMTMVIATGIALAGVLVRGARARRKLVGRPVARGGAPWWGMPVVLACLVVASAGVAFLVR